MVVLPEGERKSLRVAEETPLLAALVTAGEEPGVEGVLGPKGVPIGLVVLLAVIVAVDDDDDDALALYPYWLNKVRAAL